MEILKSLKNLIWVPKKGSKTNFLKSILSRIIFLSFSPLTSFMLLPKRRIINAGFPVTPSCREWSVDSIAETRCLGLLIWSAR